MAGRTHRTKSVRPVARDHPVDRIEEPTGRRPRHVEGTRAVVRVARSELARTSPIDLGEDSLQIAVGVDEPDLVVGHGTPLHDGTFRGQTRRLEPVHDRKNATGRLGMVLSRVMPGEVTVEEEGGGGFSVHRSSAA